MKKLLAVMLAVMIMLVSFAFADESYVGNMKVVNCKEWVSLRSEPSTESERITKIPVNSIVNECTIYDDGWAYGYYCGMYGYVSLDYLEPTDSTTLANGMLYAEIDGTILIGEYTCSDDGEKYYIEAYSGKGDPEWKYTAKCSYTTELQLVDAFIAGTDEKPMVMVYSAEVGLTALDFFTGETLWVIPDSTLSLGGSICYCVDEYGMIYIGGYYGPDPAAITPDGEVLWASNLGGRYYWLYKIEMDEDRNLVCYYEMNDETYESAIVTMPTEVE